MLARVVTAAIGIPIVLAVCSWTNPLGFLGLLIVAGTLASQEAAYILRNLKPKPAGVPVILALILVWILVPIASLNLLHWGGFSSDTIQPMWNVRMPILLALLPLWAGDSAAIFAGKAFGKHKMAPSISPKKTWEGGIANFIACVLAAWGTGAWVGIAPVYGVAIGICTGILGQAGDLFESWLKRKADVKDSGRLLPGHGGILDRIDSLLFTAIPTTFVYILASKG